MRFAAWMAAAQDGDAEAYDRLLRALLPAVRALVAARLADAALREDVVQNVLLQVHRARHTYRPERPFGPWIRAIARNAVTDALRARARRARRESPLEDEILDAAPAPPPEPAPGGALDPRLAAALGALPEAQREALELLHLHELSVAEAASRAGVTSGAMKLRAHRAVRTLRRWLGGEGS